MLLRKIIKLTAMESPNVRLGLAEERRGLEPSHQEVVPGVLSYAEYLHRRKTWDKVRQCIGLDAEFYEGAELLLFPSDWLNAGQLRGRQLDGSKRQAKGMGVDSAEGGDSTTFAAVDEQGIIEIVSMKTPDTAVIPHRALEFMRRHNLHMEPERVAFDAGGGGKQHAHRLRALGYDVRSVGFGETPHLELKRGVGLYRPFGERREVQEDKQAYTNLRSQMYWELSEAFDVSLNRQGFAIPPGPEGEELRRQLAVIPREYDERGRVMLRPKQRKPGVERGDKLPTLTELIGHSPDEADAVVLAFHAMTHKPRRVVAGGLR